MAASDNLAAAASDLRRLTAHDEAFCRAAFAQLGKGAFKCLRRGVQRTDTPPTSGDEGGSGPARRALRAPSSTTSTRRTTSPMRLPSPRGQTSIISSWTPRRLRFPSPAPCLGRLLRPPRAWAQRTRLLRARPLRGEVPPLHQCDQYRPHGGRYHCGCISAPTATVAAGNTTSAPPPSPRPPATTASAATTLVAGDQRAA